MKKERTSSGVLIIRDRQQAAAVLQKASQSRNRYPVAPVDRRTMDGIVYASEKQMKRFAGLQMLERDGEISNLRREVEYQLIVNGMLVCRYFADAVYTDTHTQKEIVEDTKGSKETTTELFKLKKKLMMACHGINVIEVY